MPIYTKTFVDCSNSVSASNNNWNLLPATTGIIIKALFSFVNFTSYVICLKKCDIPVTNHYMFKNVLVQYILCQVALSR